MPSVYKKSSSGSDKKNGLTTRWNDPSLVSEIVWNMRLADLPRGSNREIINTLFQGDPPFSESEAEENSIQVNRNDLTGVNLLTQGRRQWTQAFLKPGNGFNVQYDSGPTIKRREWGHTVTNHANRVLKKSPQYIEQCRASGGSMLLHGIGPSVWKNRKSVVCRPIDIASVLIPSETIIDFDNLSYLALFREWTPAQLYTLTHGPKRDPGWDMDVVDAQWEYIRQQVIKQPNSTAFQYMPERIGELWKQDLGFWASDAVPTVDAWDFYFRADDDEGGWYRRTVLDWGIGDLAKAGYKQGDKMPESGADGINPASGRFIYTSKNRVYADDLSEIIHFQLGDCSAVFPQRYHSIRSMAWMLWGTCDLENRLHCKFAEALFEQMMWFFRVAGNQDLMRLKRADFYHMGAIPQGIEWVKAQERFTPDYNLLQMGFGRFNKLIGDNAASFTNDFDFNKQREMTATETMARVNSLNALVSGLLSLAYTYEEFKDIEHMRRLCIKNNPDPLAQKFRKLCFEDKVPVEFLDVDRMIVTREHAIGDGNKTLEMAIVKFLQEMRGNLSPEAQKWVDHISIETATDDDALAEKLAPVDGLHKPTSSIIEAQNSTDRLMLGLPYIPPGDAIAEEFVKVWSHDLTIMVEQAINNGNMASMDQVQGFRNIEQQINAMLAQMGETDENKQKVAQYAQLLRGLMQHVDAFEQRNIEQMKAAQRNGAALSNANQAAEVQGKIQADQLLAQQKAQDKQATTAQKLAQNQVKFEMDQRQKQEAHVNEQARSQDAHREELRQGFHEAQQELMTTGAQNSLEMIADHNRRMADIENAEAEATDQ